MRWEYRVRPISSLYLLALASVAVFAYIDFEAPAFLTGWSPIGPWIETELFRQISGYSILALVGFELLLAARKRKQLKLGGRRRNWRAWHMTVGSIIIPLLLLHTGGHMGANLNSWLLFSLIAVVFVGLTGKLLEAVQIRRLTLAGSGGKAGHRIGRVTSFLHKNWVILHCLAVSAVLALLGFHILAVYYF